MTFLNPLYLVGVFAGAIPLIIHLFHKRRVKVVEFSSLEFLKRIEGRKTKWFRIREMLLLILRSLALLLLALAISRPVIRSSAFGSLGTHARSSSVFVLDNSYSMGAETAGVSNFEEAKTRAGRILNLMDKGDEVFLILASDLSRPVFEGPVHDHSLIRSAIADAALTGRLTDYRPALEMASTMIESSRNLNKEIYLFTDMQRTGFESFARGGLRDTEGKRIYIFDTSSADAVKNTALEDLALSDPLLFEGSKLTLVATLRNHTQRETSTSLRSSLDGREMGIKEVDVPAGATRSVEIAFSVEGEGVHHIAVETGDDDLVVDNARYLAFKVPGRARVALVVDDSQLSKGYVSTALSPEEGLSLFSPDVFVRGDFPSISLEDYQVLALLDVSSLNSADVLRLANFVQNGGGLLVSLGQSVDIDFYNSVLLPRLGRIRLEERAPDRSGKEFFLRISAGDFSHPVLSQFRDKEKGDLGIARIFDRVDLEASAGVLLRLSDTSPFLVETRVGEGKVMIASVPLDGSYSDLPLRAIYVPLVHRIFRYLSMGEEVMYNLHVGDMISLPTSGLEQVVCTPPGGRGTRMEPRVRSGRGYAEYDATEEPGTYVMSTDDKVLAYFSVNPHIKESDLAKAAEEEIGVHLAELRPRFLRPGESPDAEIFSVRLGVELTNPFILLVLLLLLFEMIIAGRWKGALEPEI